MSKKMPMTLATLVGLSVAIAPAMAQELESPEDRLSYTIGMDIGQSLSEQDMNLNVELLVAGMQAAYAGEETLMTQEEALAEREAFMQRRQAEMQQAMAEEAEANIAAGEAFMADNAQKEGVQVTDSGLQYRVIEPGDGAQPAASDRVTVHYRGSLIDGTVFDSSYDRGEPATFALNQVIPGWTEGVQLMSEGATYEFVIPAELAYGAEGRPGAIGPNSTLVFDVELIAVEASE